MSTHESWLWPDHAIGKRESRRLRDEHNATVNSRAELLAMCQRVESWLRELPSSEKESIPGIGNVIYNLAAANAKAEAGR